MSRTSATIDIVPVVIRSLAACMAAGVPASVVGSAGTGKSSTFEKGVGRSGEKVLDNLGERLGAWDCYTEVVSAAIRESVDFMGSQLVSDGVTCYAPLGWALRLNEAAEAGKRSILVLDEWNTADPSTLKALLRVLQEGQVGDTWLHENVWRVAIANPTDEAVDGVDIPGPIANRMIHLEWSFDRQAWLEALISGTFGSELEVPLERILHPEPEARRVEVASAVAAFLHARPDMIAPGQPKDPAEASKGWPSPRSWHNLVRVLAHVRTQDVGALRALATGAVGVGAASELIAYMKKTDLPDPEKVLNDPRSIDFEALNADQVFASSRALLTHVIDLAGSSRRRRAEVAPKALEAMMWMSECGHAGAVLPILNEILDMHESLDELDLDELDRVFGTSLANTATGARRSGTARGLSGGRRRARGTA